MNTVLASEVGLPPGLWLPTPEESTDQYLSENFATRELTAEDLGDYGSFAVALLCFEGNERPSTMPRTQDIVSLYQSGYGISYREIMLTHGGLQQVQANLGYFPERSRPDKSTLLERIEWTGNYAYKRDTGATPEDDGLVFNDLLRWGALKRYLPSSNMSYSIFEGDTTQARRLVSLEKSRAVATRSYHPLYKLGARIIAENDGPVSHSAFRENYNDALEISADVALVAKFGSHTKFWLEFDYVPTSSGLKPKNLVTLGVKHAIRNNGEILGGGKISALSAQKRFASLYPIKRAFGGVTKYQEEVKTAYIAHTRVASTLESNGVSREVVDAVSHNTVFDTSSAEGIMANSSVLAAFGERTRNSKFMLGILRSGFDLLDDAVFSLQINDFLCGLEHMGFDLKAKQFILSLVPRINPEEALAMSAQ